MVLRKSRSLNVNTSFNFSYIYTNIIIIITIFFVEFFAKGLIRKPSHLSILPKEATTSATYFEKENRSYLLCFMINELNENSRQRYLLER